MPTRFEQQLIEQYRPEYDEFLEEIRDYSADLLFSCYLLTVRDMKQFKANRCNDLPRFKNMALSLLAILEEIDRRADLYDMGTIWHWINSTDIQLSHLKIGQG